MHDKKSAKIKAFAEAIERHHSSYLDEDIWKHLQTFNYKEINTIIGANIYNQESMGIGKKSFEILPIWEDILIGNEIQIPGEIIFYPYIDNTLYFANSNGTGAGRSYEEALLGGLFELSERDSLMLMWLKKLTPKRIDNTTLPEDLQFYILHIESKYHGKITLLDISFWKTFPHIFGFFKGDNRYEMWASCKSNSYKAIEKVISEILNNIDIKEKHKRISIEEASEFKDHKRFYTDNENFKNLSFLYKNNEIISYKNIKTFNSVSLWKTLKVFINDVGGKFYITDLTTTYSQKLWLYVVKILSENMIPIWFWRKSLPQIPYNKKRLKYFNKNFLSTVPDFLHFFD